MERVITSAAFQDSLMIITFDESEVTDIAHGGGHIPTLIISPRAKAAYQSTTFYQHQSALRLTLEALGITDFPGESAAAPGMSEFF